MIWHKNNSRRACSCKHNVKKALRESKKGMNKESILSSSIASPNLIQLLHNIPLPLKEKQKLPRYTLVIPASLEFGSLKWKSATFSAPWPNMGICRQLIPKEHEKMWGWFVDSSCCAWARPLNFLGPQRKNTGVLSCPSCTLRCSILLWQLEDRIRTVLALSPSVIATLWIANKRSTQTGLQKNGWLEPWLGSSISTALNMLIPLQDFPSTHLRPKSYRPVSANSWHPDNECDISHWQTSGVQLERSIAMLLTLYSIPWILYSWTSPSEALKTHFPTQKGNSFWIFQGHFPTAHQDQDSASRPWPIQKIL